MDPKHPLHNEGQKKFAGEATWFDKVLDQAYQHKRPLREHYDATMEGFEAFRRDRNARRRKRQGRK